VCRVCFALLPFVYAADVAAKAKTRARTSHTGILMVMVIVIPIKPIQLRFGTKRESPDVSTIKHQFIVETIETA
jgi:hypothetical protein